MNQTLEAFRCCITDRKCMNKDCPYESRCQICNNQSQYLQIPKHLALDVERMLVDLILYKEDKEGKGDRMSSEELKKYTINLYDLLGALVEYGQHDKQFKLGDIIKYDPVSVVEIAREFLDNHR